MGIDSLHAVHCAIQYSSNDWLMRLGVIIVSISMKYMTRMHMIMMMVDIWWWWWRVVIHTEQVKWKIEPLRRAVPDRTSRLVSTRSPSRHQPQSWLRIDRSVGVGPTESHWLPESNGTSRDYIVNNEEEQSTINSLHHHPSHASIIVIIITTHPHH